MQPDTSEYEEFSAALIEAGLAIPTGVPGVFGRNAVFESVIEAVNEYITNAGASDNPELIRFPPVVNRNEIVRSGYLKSFPQLAGTIFSFEGTPADHAKMLDLIHEGKDWKDYQTMTDLTMTPAACYPIYPLCASRGPVPNDGLLFDVYSYCFRHEPSMDPARGQVFRLREFVKVAPEAEILPWRDLWLDRSEKLMLELGLPVVVDLANDPFFGRGGRMLALDQRQQQLKHEILVPICSQANPTAIMSVNYHQEHFGSIFGIKTGDGSIAHTACTGFGMERIALAMFKVHGLNPADWPSSVRGLLWPLV